MLTGMSMLGLTGGMLGAGAATAAPAGAAVTPHAEGMVTTPAGTHVRPDGSSYCYFYVEDNPTPVFYSNWNFYEYKHTGDIVTGPYGAVSEHNGIEYQLVYLGIGGVGWMDLHKLQFEGC
jgi:hypothetical protein